MTFLTFCEFGFYKLNVVTVSYDETFSDTLLQAFHSLSKFWCRLGRDGRDGRDGRGRRVRRGPKCF